MADETQPPPGTITQDILARWAMLPRDGELAFALTPQTLDYLFLAIRETVIAVADLRTATIAASKGDLDAAQKAFDASGLHQAHALRNIDTLIIHTMNTVELINNER